MKRLAVVIALLSMVALLHTTASAVGIGAYFDLDPAGGNVKTTTSGWGGGTHNGTSKVLAIGGGLVFDSNVLGASVFNYRMKLGGEKIWGDKDTEFDGASGHWQNIFGFRVFGNNRVRLWLGPTFGLRYITGDFSDVKFSTEGEGVLHQIFMIENPGIYYSTFLGNIGIHSIDAKYTLFGFDTGLVFGMNFGLTDSLVLSGEVAAKYLLFAGSATRKVITVWSLTTVAPDYLRTKQTITAHNWDVNISLSFMFRVGEQTAGRTGRRR